MKHKPSNAQVLATCFLCALLLPTAVKANPLSAPKATPIWEETPTLSQKQADYLPIKPNLPFEKVQLR